MNRALWKKSFTEARWLLLGCVVILFAFHWLRIWISSQLTQSQVLAILNLIPDFAKQLSPVPLEQVATTAGRIAVAYDDPLVLFVVTVWGIARGSDAVSGEIGRGTMEVLLAQPVTRAGVLWAQALVTILGAALIALAGWLGTTIGLATIALEEHVSASVFLPAAGNVFSLIVFLAGISTLASSWDRYRGRTIGVVGTFYAVEMVAKIVDRTVPRWRWLEYWTFFTPFEPQALISDRQHAWSLYYSRADGALALGGLGYDGILIGLGLAAYVTATVIFCRRDLPAPL